MNVLPPFAERFALPEVPAAPAVAAARADALERAARHGLPTRRDERWRYSELRPLAQRRWRVAADAAHAAASDPGFPVALRIEVGPAGATVHGATPPGITVEVVEATREDAAERMALGIAAPDAPAELNAALAPRAVRIHVGADARLEHPILVEHRLPASPDLLFTPRVLVELAPAARARLIERLGADHAADGFLDAVTRVTLGRDSALEHVHVQDLPAAVAATAWLDAEVAGGARHALHAVVLGGAPGRCAARIRLVGEGASADLHALNAVDGRRHADLHLEVVHEAGRTASRQVYRGLAGGRGRAAATSRAVVRRDAAGCDAAQSLGSLLLSPHAEADARPELEIENDDVRCSHGATIGQLDEAALFYLRSRGLGLEEARAALVFAFADDALAALPRGPLRDHLEARLRSRLAGEAPR